MCSLSSYYLSENLELGGVSGLVGYDLALAHVIDGVGGDDIRQLFHHDSATSITVSLHLQATCSVLGIPYSSSDDFEPASWLLCPGPWYQNTFTLLPWHGLIEASTNSSTNHSLFLNGHHGTEARFWRRPRGEP